MTPKNYLFGPFIGETKFELNYFVGHAIYLEKQNVENKIIVLTRRANFDLYGKYATTLLPLPLDDELEPKAFGCKNIRANVFDEIVRRFRLKFEDRIKIHEHYYPRLSTHLRDLKWYYPRNEIDFNFKPRSKNMVIAGKMASDCKNIILSDVHNTILSYNQYDIFPVYNFFNSVDYLKTTDDASVLGTLIEFMKLTTYVLADVDSIVGRLAMLMQKPLITRRESLDARDLNPINPYKSIVIGCKNFTEGVNYLEEIKWNQQ